MISSFIDADAALESKPMPTNLCCRRQARKLSGTSAFTRGGPSTLNSLPDLRSTSRALAACSSKSNHNFAVVRPLVQCSGPPARLVSEGKTIVAATPSDDAAVVVAERCVYREVGLGQSQSRRLRHFMSECTRFLHVMEAGNIEGFGREVAQLP